MIPYARQSISTEDIERVIAVLKSDFLTQGPCVAQFEDDIAALCGVRFAIASNSGTSSLYVAYRSLDLGSGDLLWTSPNTFVATSNAALQCGADVDFVDIDPKTYNMCVNSLEEKLRAGRRSGRLPKIVAPVHFAGQPCDMRRIKSLAEEYGFKVVEDASHALGALYLGRPVGNCEFSDITVLSFHPVKIITTGEGGMTVTNDPKLAASMKRLVTHGITRNQNEMIGTPDGSWYYEQLDLSHNFRLTDIQAALGSSQLRRLEDFLARRRQLAAQYTAAFAGTRLTLPYQHAEGTSSWHLYVIGVPSAKRKALFDALREVKIGVNVHYIPVHFHPYYQKLGFNRQQFPRSVEYYESAISLPMFYGLSDLEQQEVVGKVTEISDRLLSAGDAS